MSIGKNVLQTKEKISKRGISRKGVLPVFPDQHFKDYAVTWRWLPIAEEFVITLSKKDKTEPGGIKILDFHYCKTKAEALRTITKFKRQIPGWRKNIY